MYLLGNFVNLSLVVGITKIPGKYPICTLKYFMLLFVYILPSEIIKKTINKLINSVYLDWLIYEGINMHPDFA